MSNSNVSEILLVCVCVCVRTHAHVRVRTCVVLWTVCEHLCSVYLYTGVYYYYTPCMSSHVGLTVNNVTSSPDGYGIAGEQVKLRCNFQPTQLSIDIMWTFTNANGDTSVVMPTTEVSMDPGIGYGELVIPDFRDEHSGNYRCLISVLDGDNNVLGGITSAEKTIKLAGNLLNVYRGLQIK